MRLHWFVSSPNRRFGALRKLLPGWARSPLRRLVQAGAFAAFFLLVFWQLRPVPPDGTSSFQLPPQVFLWLDPLANASAAVAARTFTASLLVAGGILLLSIALPRMFCGYICPLGTLIDLSDWLVTGRFRRLHVSATGWFANLKYYGLLVLLACAAFGALASGVFAAIPLLTRGLTASLGYLQAAHAVGAENLPPLEWQNYAAVAMLLGVLLLSLMGKRFWCRFVCPTGALFSLAGLLRLHERKVADKCVECGQCAGVCTFGAIRDDFSTRTADCAFCQECGAACPVGAITFASRWERMAERSAAKPAPHISLSRRGFLASGLSGLVLVAVPLIGRANRTQSIRPPGSKPEEQFLDLCVRCGLCMKACPTNLLQPVGFDQKLEQLWTPRADADFGRCDPGCNLCGKVCPTGAIQLLTVDQKKKWQMGLAAVDKSACLAHRGQDCSFCGEACANAGFGAIELQGDAPVVRGEKCVGCGACQNACHANVVRAGKLNRPAIRVGS